MRKTILLHGIFLPKQHLHTLNSSLAKEGFDTVNIGYPSTKYPIEELANIIHQGTQKALRPEEEFNIVAFSMGGLITRAFIKKYAPKNLNRIVMIGTPNQGSEIADKFYKHWWFRKLCGPAGKQLRSNQSEIQHLFADIKHELGIIAGSKPSTPLFNKILPSPNDGKVSVESTKLNGMTKHVVVPCSHSLLPFSKQVHQLTSSFLKTGSFLSS